MTEFETMINGGNEIKNAINCVIFDLGKGGTFDAWVNADSIVEVERKLPLGYELDKITTLQNYFAPAIVDEFEIEIRNSQYIYFEKFTRLYDGGFYRYIDAMKSGDYTATVRLDRQSRR
ncbi:hypothetical protein SECTIM467_177 [Brevibacillus phage SecTim467]|uniref:Uncharacterized protein n=2 Tax=Jenstvirus jenst TaxID=1982225 RepID=A0A0K2CP45_9CAUD|nr:hypothetical protein AVV11_gp019 [Brevibacillus phage Jenst]ALA07301.1 hypothetical protein JENST_172 [Brevibacillus phage Jenst]ALA07498.1 hypothetical protein SECTIM467_177 [Brevibacillus phage SecTim467]